MPSIDIKKPITKFLKSIEKLGYTKKRRILLAAIGLAFANLAYSLFSLYTLISCTLLIISIGLFIKIKVEVIRKIGVINYLPHSIAKTLTQRSLFDIICDIWFFPRIASYIKAFLTPFIYKIEPEEAIYQFQDLSPEVRKAILTKGIVNILPNSAKSILLPKSDMVSEVSSEVSSEEDNFSDKTEKEEEEKNNHEGKTVGDIIFNESSSGKSIAVSKPIETKLNSPELYKGGHTSTDDDSLVNHNFSLNKQRELKKSLPSFPDLNNPIEAHLDLANWNKDMKQLKQAIKNRKSSSRNKGSNLRLNPKLEKFFKQDPASNIKSEVICSNKLLEKKSKPIVCETWDKIDLYVQKKRESQMNKGNKEVPTKQLKGHLQILQSLPGLLSKDALLKRIEDKKLLKIFLVSTLVLVVQLSISKRTRYMCYNMIHILLYVSGFTLSAGTLTIFIMKMRQKIIENRKKKQQEKEKEKEKKAIQVDTDEE